ncbi:MAG: cell division protein FtsZ [Treponemataceae bacterium]|nr:cell division protein FtsZ [Treponema sp.]MBD5413934.1 cell division protein FtsZ [Treponema sp.]MBD5443316.1 cell division protein FtsZ [Treponema sp.]MDE6245313.1 cell division protein FtsZ [Treponemataceae bacterium]
MEFDVVDNEGSILGNVNPTVIKVIGCGGGGSNAVRNMIEADIKNVDFIAMNTDAQALSKSIAKIRIPIGQKLTQGLGAGGDPAIGEKAAEEDQDSICNALRGANMVFVTAGMGGGTGTGSAPVVARLAKEMGILTVAIVTTPFTWEGPLRAKLAKAGLEKLYDAVDSIIVIPNSKILTAFPDLENATLIEQLRLADDVLRQAIEGVINIVTVTGVINIDFADVKKAIENQKTTLFGMGSASGKGRATEAATNAINNPMLEDMNIDGAKHILVNVIASNPTTEELQEIATIVSKSAAIDVYELKQGVVIDPDKGDELSVTVIATGFGDSNRVSKENEVAQDEAKAEEVEKGENEGAKNENFISLSDFNALSSKKTSQSPSRNPLLFSQGEDEKEAKPGDYGSFGSVNANKKMGHYVDENDLSVPTYSRNLSRTINFNKNKQE